MQNAATDDLAQLAVDVDLLFFQEPFQMHPAELTSEHCGDLRDSLGSRAQTIDPRRQNFLYGAGNTDLLDRSQRSADPILADRHVPFLDQRARDLLAEERAALRLGENLAL